MDRTSPALTRASLALAALVSLAGCGDGADRVTVEIGRSSQADARSEREPPPQRGAPPAVPGVQACSGARTPTTNSTEREAEQTIRCLTNAVRVKQGLQELAFDEQLARAAQTRSDSMARLDYFSHDGPQGGNVRRAVRRTGYIPREQSWYLGENIGWAPEGQATPAQLMRAWLDSPTHRANILNSGFTEMGVGVIAAVPKQEAEPGATYTQVFGVIGDGARQAQAG